jgi:hypothetical protein
MMTDHIVIRRTKRRSGPVESRWWLHYTTVGEEHRTTTTRRHAGSIVTAVVDRSGIGGAGGSPTRRQGQISVCLSDLIEYVLEEERSNKQQNKEIIIH